MSGTLLPGVLIGLSVAALLLAGCNDTPVQPVSSPTLVSPTAAPLARLDGKRALFVVPDRFREAEHRIPREILEDLGVRVTVASWSLDPLLGTHGVTLQPELQLCDVCADDYDAFVFVGGDGVRPTEAEVQRIVREARAQEKVLAAICASQGILSYAGLVETGGVPSGTVVRDGLIITASGSASSREFGVTIATALGE